MEVVTQMMILVVTQNQMNLNLDHNCLRKIAKRSILATVVLRLKRRKRRRKTNVASAQRLINGGIRKEKL